MTDTYEPFPQSDAPRGETIPPAPPRAAPDFAPLSLHKVLLVAGIAIATILPNMVISNLIEEREQREAGVRQEFTRNWGPEQNLYSPTLVIPFQSGAWQQRQYVKVAPALLDF